MCHRGNDSFSDRLTPASYRFASETIIGKSPWRRQGASEYNETFIADMTAPIKLEDTTGKGW